MKETGLLFTPENYAKCENGSKTQTRRIVDTVDESISGIRLVENVATVPTGPLYTGWVKECGAPMLIPIKCKYGTVGDRLYVKEGLERSPGGLTQYRREPKRVVGWAEWKWKQRTLSSMFMPKDLARLWLEISEVRVEQVQEISEEDAIAEGIELLEGSMNPDDFTGCWRNYDPHAPEPYWNNPIDSFHSLWVSIYGPGSWVCNDWVWVLSYRRIQL